MVLRPTYPYQIPLAKTSRRGRDFVSLYRIVFPRSSSYAAYSSCLGLLYILEYLIVRLVRFVLLLLLFKFVMHCIISTVVVAFEINYLLSIYYLLLSIKRRRFENQWDQTFCFLLIKDVLSVMESANLGQRQNLKQKWFGIRIRIFGLIWVRMSVVSVPKLWVHYLVGVSHFAKYGTNRLLIVWKFRKQRNANKCPKIAYSSAVNKMIKWSGIHAQIRITSKSQPLLEGHLLLVPAKFGRRPFPRSSVILFTEWQLKWKNDRERSHNIRLIDGGNNNNNML